MKASMGGILSLFLIATFFVLLMSFLLFNVSYAKAFRVKNKIITTYEQYEGNCDTNTNCYNEIKRFEEAYGYRVTYQLKETKGTKCYQELGYCSTMKRARNGSSSREVTFIITTEVFIRFPLIEDVLGIGRFGISGETHKIVLSQ